jgi:basic membrane protein A and related proteins
MTRNIGARWCIGLVGVFAATLLTSSASAQQLKIGILLPGSTADNGYNADGARAAQALKSELKADVQTTENVSVANQADLYRQYAAKGYNVVVGWGGQFTDGAVQVAQEFPDVKFIVVNSGVENGKNLASIDTDIQDWEFLGGFVTAKLSKTGVIGWIGGQCFPATAANLHGVEQGAKYADANIKVLSTFTGDFEDPTKAQQAAQAMIDSGKAGALTGNLNNGWFGVFKAARDNGKIPVVTEWVDNHAQASDVIASSIQKSQAKFVVAVVKEISPGKFQGRHYQFGITPEWGDVMTKTNLLPESLLKEVAGLQAKITSGEIKPKNVADCPK